MDDKLIFAYLAQLKLFSWKAKWHIVLVDLQTNLSRAWTRRQQPPEQAVICLI